MTDDGLAADDGGSGMTGSDESDSEGSLSSDSSAGSSVSVDHSLSDHSGFKFKHRHPDESRYSGTNSENPHGDTAGSRSLGTSDNSDDPSVLSTVSIIEVLPFNFYGVLSGTDGTSDSTSITTLEILDNSGRGGEDED